MTVKLDSDKGIKTIHQEQETNHGVSSSTIWYLPIKELFIVVMP